jgi:AraC family transcriptional regulator of adaptative response/methylated-DNA-[protein]-cysteine methyltransferase
MTQTSTIEHDPRWQSVSERDHAADGAFFFGVRTTGIYCRASCPAKRPKPENVSFFTSTHGAERAGLRPCKRCHPDRPELWKQNSDVIAEICRVIEASDAIPNLDALAKKSGFSAHHLHRLFKQATGVTPRQYALAHRAKRVRENLAKGNSVTSTIHANGYSSTSRFYEDAGKMLGMKPGQYKSGGANMKIEYAIGDSSLGKILVATTERGICAIYLDSSAKALVAELYSRFPKANIEPANKTFEKTVAKVVAFAENPKRALDLPLDLQGTAFQQRVWNALQKIPAGKTMTYGEIAKKIGAPDAVRAVGTACGANHVSLVVPCHRVIGKDGKLTGYRWGVERKKKLLERERD